MLALKYKCKLTCACNIIQRDAAAFFALRTTAPTSCGSPPPAAASTAGGATFCCCSTCVYDDDMTFMASTIYFPSNSANLSLVPHRKQRLTLLFYYFEVRKIRGMLLILCVLAVEKKQCAMPTFVFFFSQLDSIHVVINRPSMYVKIEKLMVTTTGASLA